MKTHRVTLLLALVVLMMSRALAGDVPARWIGGSGNWANAANWDIGQVPNNAGATTYSVILDVAGSDSVITVSQPITIKGLITSETLQITDSGNLTLSGGVTNAGTLSVEGGTLRLSGATVVNHGHAITADRGSVELAGGSIRGGTVTTANGARLQGANGGVLDGVVLNADLYVQSVRVINGLVLNGTATIGAPGDNKPLMEFTGSQTLSGSGTVVLGDVYGAALRLTGAGATLTLGPGVTVRGGAGLSGALEGPDDGWLINQGTIVADVSGRSIAINTLRFRNDGVAEARNGDLLLRNLASNNGTLLANGGALSLGGVWTNASTITLNNGTLNLGGSFTLATLGTLNCTDSTVNLTGTLNNQGTELALSAATGSWQLKGGTIRGGTVSGNGGARLVGTAWGGVLDGVVLNADLYVQSVRVVNGLVLNGTVTIGATGDNKPLMEFTGSQTLSGSGTVVLGDVYGSALRLTGAGATLTLGPGVTVRGGTALGASIEGPGDGWLVNQGTIVADVSGRTIAINTLRCTNRGLLKAMAGGVLAVRTATSSSEGNLEVYSEGTIDFTGALQFADPHWLASRQGGILKVTGDILGNTHNAKQYVPWGTVQFTGAGTAVSPQRLEVMGGDFGPGYQGLASNYLYGVIVLANNTYVHLVDLEDNAPGAGPEALYVNSLVVPTGTTLDLNNLHVYARFTQVSGQVSQGTVTLIPDGGPIALGLANSGALAVPGEVDEWSFFARAGQLLAVVADPGTSVPTPQLSWVRIRLLNSAGQVLAEKSSTAAGVPVILTDILLPADGVYRVMVQAPASQAASVGNYTLTVWDATGQVNPITFNQVANGTINTPYSVDLWTFSAVAGQQVRFDLVAASGPSLLFDLTGPNGWTGFTNLTGDSALQNLPAAGSYAIKVHAADARTGDSYAFRLEVTAQEDLAVGTIYNGQLLSNGQAQLFLITVTNKNPLRVGLSNAGAGNRVELYVGRGAPPTRGAFDYQAASGPGANRDLVIPTASVGNWYVLVYGDHVATPGPFSIQVTTAGVFLASTAPSRNANNAALVMTLTGAGFEAGTAVELLTDAGAPFAATNVSVDSYSQLTATFLPNFAPPGIYSVRVRQPDGDAATLTQAFEMLPPGEPKLETRLVMPGGLGRHAVATIYVEYANTGNAAMPAPLLLLKSADPDGSDKPVLTLDQSRVIQNFWSAGLPPGTANQVLILASGSQPGVLNPGERIQAPVYYLGLQQPWDFSDSQVELEIRFWLADDPTPIDWAARKETLRPPTLDAATWELVYHNLTSDLTNSGAYVQMLDDNAQYLGRLGQRVVDVHTLWTFEVQQAYGYSAIPVLDSAVDAILPSPGVRLDLTRRFSSNLHTRNSTGLFGRGWYAPWQARLVVENGGDLVRIIGEGGSARLFTRDTRNGSYFSGPGDTSQLKAIGGGVYELRDRNGIVTRFRSEGGIDYVQDANSNRVTSAYDTAGRLVTLTHTSGASLLLSYNGAGLVSSAVDSAGRSVTYDYDPSNIYLLTVKTCDGKATSYTYETAGTPAQRHALTSVSRGGTVRHFTYDTHGRLDATYLASGEQLFRFNYDSAGGVTVVDARGTTSLYFDHHSLLAKETDALGHVTTAEFNNDRLLHRLVTPSGESQSFTWGSNGSLASFTDELGHTVAFRYDDPLERLTSFTDARGNTTRYTYDLEGNLLATIYPNNSVERLDGYTASGLPQEYTNRRGQPVSYTYTPSGQVDRQTFADGSYADFDYDAREHMTAVTEHPISGPDRITAYTYDYGTACDRLRKVTYPNGRWVEFFYDSFGRRERINDSAGGDTRHEFDLAGRIWKLRNATNGVLTEYLYNPSGRLERANKGNGTYTTYHYDPVGELLHLINYAPNGTVNSRFDFTYDCRGRRRTMQTLEGNWTYECDAIGQLTRAIFVSSSPAFPNQDFQYGYDAAGNRTSTIVNGVKTDYVANDVNQYTSVGGAACQYDADANLTFDGVRSYAYDAQSRLVQVTGPEGVTEHEYSVLGHRTATVLNGHRTEYVVNPTGLADVLAEHDDAGNLLANHVFGLGLVASAQGGGTLSYFDFDALGSTVGITANDATVANSYAYSPFGDRLVSQESLANAFEFVGQFGVMGDATGLDYMRRRSYASKLGRFTTIDPIRLLGSDANFYRYAHNDPIARIDPNGLWDSCSSSRIAAGGIVIVGSALCTILTVGTGAIICVGGIGLAGLVSAELCTPDDGGGGGAGGGSAGGCSGGGCGGGTGGGCGGPGGGGGGCGGPSGSSGGGSGGGDGGGGDWGLQVSLDPNQKLGPSGVGSGKYVLPGAALAYRIDFENEPTASAPAQEVIVTDSLSPSLDWQTFQLTDLGFGDVLIPAPAKTQHFETNVLVTRGGTPFEVQVETGIRIASGQVYAVFRSIDPATSLPPDVLSGFLPPEDGTGRGKGHLNYLINARTNLPTGAQIRNVALIEFDRQNSIATNQREPHNPAAGTDPTKECLNTVDSGAPASRVAPLASPIGRTFMVRWAGEDDASGVANYDVYVSTNGTDYARIMERTEATSFAFVGELGQTYHFYSVARDQVGNEEAAHLEADTVTTVHSNAPLLLAASNQVLRVGAEFALTNLVQGTPVGSFLFTLGPRPPAGMTLNATNGVLRWTPSCQYGSSTNSVTVWVVDTGWTDMTDAVAIELLVRECVEPTLGTLILPVGQRGRLPLHLATSEALTNLTMTLELPPDRLVDPSVEVYEPVTSPVCTAAIEPIAERLNLISLEACSNHGMYGTQQVAWLYLTAATAQPSAFVNVKISDFIGTQPDGTRVTNSTAQLGRVVIIGREPLLEASLSTNGSPMLTLYGNRGTNYQVLDTRSLDGSATWQPGWNVALTNLFHIFPPIRTDLPTMFYRAVESP